MISRGCAPGASRGQGGRSDLQAARLTYPNLGNVFRGILFATSIAAAITTTGCATTLGYVPENIKPRQIHNKDTLSPTYGEVKKWAYDVQDGYDSRATINRHAIYFGAALAAAAVGTLAGLAIFDSGSPAIAGIPIGTGFLAGVAAIYNSDQKADMYSRASNAMKAIINASDQRVANGASPDAREAVCLKRNVDTLMGKVARHIVLMEPKNVVAELSKVQPNAEKDIQELLQAAKGDFSDLNSITVSCDQ